MFQRLLVPLDGSTRAELALPVAARLARASGGTVVLLRVVSPPTELPSSTTSSQGTSTELVAPDFAVATNYLQRITRMSSLLDIHTETVVNSGQASATILSTVVDHKIDLIVLSSHGYTGIKHQVLGSVAEHVAHYAPIPVFVKNQRSRASGGCSATLVPTIGDYRSTTIATPCPPPIHNVASP